MPARRRAPSAVLPALRSSRGGPRAVAALGIEELEDRFQPSAAGAFAALPAPDFDAAVIVRAVDEPPPTWRHELVLVAPGLPDRDALVRDLRASRPGGTVEFVELAAPGVAGVTAALRGRTGLDAVHLLSHGSSGALDLGGIELDAATLGGDAAEVRGWGAALNPGADRLVYGCDIAADPAGRALVARFAELTGADVAASTDRTGAAPLGGDWALEYHTGSIEALALSAGGWAHTLAAPFGLLLVTDGDVTNSGVPGVQSWTAGTVLNVGGPNFALEPGTTNGTFSALFNINNFAPADVKVDALHYVHSAITVGTGPASMNLLPGDLLLSIGQGNKTLTSLNTLTVGKDDVFVFRPGAGGNYAAGTFLPLLDNFKAVTGGNDTWGVALVEAATTVGDVTVPAGSFLFVRQGGAEDDDVRLFVPTGVGAGTTAGTVSVLIDGAQLGIGKRLNGVGLVESTTTVGGRTLPAGTLLIATDSASVGTGGNQLAVTKYDIVALAVTKTTLGSGTAVATPSLLFQGSDVGLNSGAEVIRGFSLAASNAPPVAAADAYMVLEDATLTIGPATGVLANDTDANGDALTAVLLTNPTNGTVALNSNGGFTYTPRANFSGTDSFTYTVSDGRGGTATGTVTITVAPVNDVPSFSLSGNAPAVNEDAGPQTVPGFATAIDPGPNEGAQTVTFVVTGNTNPGLFAVAPAVAADGTLTYTPAPDASGTATLTLVLRDNGGTANGGQDTSSARTFTITVNAVNDPPTLNPIAGVTVTEDSGPQTVPLNGITAGGGEAQALSVTATSDNPSVVPNPVVSYTSPNGTGTLTYAPAANASGTATITVTVRDAGLNGFLGDADDAVTTRQFTVTVTPVADPPVAAPDTYSTPGGVPLALGLPGVLANDTDPDGGPLTAALVSGPASGALVLLPDGSFTYTPALGFSGVVTFTYQAFDPQGNASAPATVTVNVGQGNRPPVAGADALTTAEDVPLSGTVLGNDSDPDGDPLSVTLLTGPADGTLVLNPDGTFTYTPGPNFSGTDSFSYTLSDGALTDTAAVTLTVTAVNDAPVAGADTGTVAEDGTVTIGVRANDTDAENDPLTVVAVTQPARGAATTDGSTVTYTPDPDFSGTDTFTYTVSDGNGGTATATVTVTVTAVNDPPTLDPVAAQTVAEDGGSRAVALTGITAGGGEAQPLTVTAVSSNPAVIPNPVVSYTSPNGTGTLTYTPAANVNGTATVTVTVSDGATTITRSFVVTVTAVNDAPTVTPVANQTVPEDGIVGPLAFTVGDAETPAGALTVVATSGNPALLPDANIVVTATGGGGRQINLTPAPNASGTVVITLTVSDGTASTTTAFTLTVTPVNDAPVAVADSYATDRDTRLSVPASGVLVNDTDADADVLTAVLASGPQHGTLQLNPDGSFVYDPDPGFEGFDSFTYSAADPSGAVSGTAAVVIAVRTPGRPPTAAPDEYTADRRVVWVGGRAGVLANDTDPDGDRLTAELLDRPAHGALLLTRPGGFLYVADAGFVGTDTFTYRAVDRFGNASAPVSVTVHVPSTGAAADEYTVVQNRTLEAPSVVPAGDDNELSVRLISGPAHGTVVMRDDGSFTYTPRAGFVGTDTFSYRISDRDAAVVRTARITVTPAAETPTPPAQPAPRAPAARVPLGAPAAAEPTAAPSAGPVVVTTVAESAAAVDSADQPVPAAPGVTVPVLLIAANVPPAAAPADAGDAKLPPAAPAVPAAVQAQPPAPAPVVQPPAPGPAAPAAAPAAPVVEPDEAVETVSTALEKVSGDLAEAADQRAAADAVVATAAVATAGYVLLNTRAVYWFLSALLARPAVWRRFDPLEVIYAWEQERDADARPAPAAGGESLESMVG